MPDLHTDRFPFLLEDDGFLKIRSEIALKYYNSCIHSSQNDCIDSFLGFLKQKPSEHKLAFEAGRATTFIYFHRNALPFYLMALENSKNSDYCNDDRLPLAVANAVPMATEQLGSMGMKIARDYCYPQVKNSLVSILEKYEGHSPHLKPICDLLKSKGDLSKNIATKCM
ncbi:MAG: hypothetical protein A2Z20_06760 [Bdellovibrionales bacterium RBG_16_40_8]|nr:MAG: hypothetical protein A2Z20_06760 [Bdellovibrionales bacterium RBG_16_40_8]